MPKKPTLLRHVGLIAVLAAQPLLGHAGAPVQLDRATCKPATEAQLKVLPTEFKRYGAFTKLCRVPKAKPALWVAAVWADDYYRSLPGMPEAEDIPRPVIIATEGKVLATLPAHYPGEDALTTAIKFSRM